MKLQLIFFQLILSIMFAVVAIYSFKNEDGSVPYTEATTPVHTTVPYIVHSVTVDGAHLKSTSLK